MCISVKNLLLYTERLWITLLRECFIVGYQQIQKKALADLESTNACHVK